MTDDQTPSVTEQLSDVTATVTDSVKSAASTIRGAIEEGRKPGNSLDTLSKVVRQAPPRGVGRCFFGRASL